MSDPFQAQEMRQLLSVARTLRGAAGDFMTGAADRHLFAAAAAALEARAHGMATALPGDRYAAGIVQMHRPVDLLA